MSTLKAFLPQNGPNLHFPMTFSLPIDASQLQNRLRIPSLTSLALFLSRSLRSLFAPQNQPPSPPTLKSALSGCSVPLFRPYVSRVPWHGGARAFLSQLFPRYGHYCGPNWSSGKDGGSLLWDRRPIDWLDFCCYCHDIGYDTDDQALLLKADLAFLECLERPRVDAKGDPLVALLYRSMYIAGLRSIIIPYRIQLVRLKGMQPVNEKFRSFFDRDRIINHFTMSHKIQSGLEVKERMFGWIYGRNNSIKKSFASSSSSSSS